MSSKKSKSVIWVQTVKAIGRMNSERLKARWYAIHITKDAFRTKTQKRNLKEIEKILKSRDVKPDKPKRYN